MTDESKKDPSPPLRLAGPDEWLIQAGRRAEATLRSFPRNMLGPAGRKLMASLACTCEDMTTPAYPEFAAVARDPECPVHSKKENN